MREDMTPVADDENLFRRIKDGRGHFCPETGWVSPAAFHPLRYDATGISVDRETYRTAEQAAQSTRPGDYYVVRLLTGRVRSLGLSVEPRPFPENRGHAEIPEIRYETRRTTVEQELQLSRLCFGAEGPFSTEAGTGSAPTQ